MSNFALFLSGLHFALKSRALEQKSTVLFDRRDETERRTKHLHPISKSSLARRWGEVLVRS